MPSRGRRATSRSYAREAIALKRRMEEIVALHSGQPLEKVYTDMERDYFLTAEGPKEYGLIDNVLVRRFESMHDRPRSYLRRLQTVRHAANQRHCGLRPTVSSGSARTANA